MQGKLPTSYLWPRLSFLLGHSSCFSLGNSSEEGSSEVMIMNKFETQKARSRQIKGLNNGQENVSQGPMVGTSKKLDMGLARDWIWRLVMLVDGFAVIQLPASNPGTCGRQEDSGPF